MSVRRSGFLLLDMIATLAVIAVLAVVGTELLNTSMRITHEATDAVEAQARMTSAIESLQHDAWNARSIKTNGDLQLHLEIPAALPIDWSLDSGDLVRKQGDQTRRWAGVGSGCIFIVDGPSVILRSTVQGEIQEMRFASQLKLAAAEEK